MKVSNRHIYFNWNETFSILKKKYFNWNEIFSIIKKKKSFYFKLYLSVEIHLDFSN